MTKYVLLITAKHADAVALVDARLLNRAWTSRRFGEPIVSLTWQPGPAQGQHTVVTHLDEFYVTYLVGLTQKKLQSEFPDADLVFQVMKVLNINP